MKSLIHQFPIYTSYAFIVLFTYAAASKMLDFENFQVQLAQSPLLSAYAGQVSYGVIAVELLIAALLFFDHTRRIGLYCSFGLMVSFTVYIWLILNYSDHVPCSCGGILEELTWNQHLIFNLGFVLLALSGIFFIEKERAHGWRRSAASAALTALLAAGGIVALFLSSEHIIKKENNFTRRFLQHPITETAKFDLQVNSYYFAGATAKSVYLGNTTAPFLLTSLNRKLTQKNLLFLGQPQQDVLLTAPRMQVYDPYFYLYDGRVPIIYRGRLDSSAIKTISYREAYFNQLAIIDTSNFAVRTVVAQPKHFALGKMDLRGKSRFMMYERLLPRTPKSLFETDGSLVRDAQTSDLVYVYSYKNTFEVIDRKMNHKRQFNTIDTTKSLPLRFQTLENGDKRLLSPPPKVNNKAVVHGGVLFIESSVIGKFESKKIWKEASVIDCYATGKQEYLGSFYLYHRGNSKLSDMLITGDQLYVIMGSELICYQLASSITKHFQRGEAENLIKE